MEMNGQKEPSLKMKRKKMLIELVLNTGQGNYAACEMVEQALMNSSLNNSEYALIINETKVIGEWTVP